MSSMQKRFRKKVPVPKIRLNTPRAQVVAKLRGALARVSAESKVPRAFARPRMGERGVSGPRGEWFTQEMQSRIQGIATNAKSPHYHLARQLSKILNAATSEQLLLEQNSVETQRLVNVLTGVLLAQARKKVFTPNKAQTRALTEVLARIK